MSAGTAAVVPTEIPSTAPPKAGKLLGTLIIVATFANPPPAMANVALLATSSHALEHLP
jgi:hypothetical protein